MGRDAWGSNPCVPTTQTPTKSNRPKANPRGFRAFREMTRDSHFSSCWPLLVYVRVRIRTQIRTRRPEPLSGSQLPRGVDFQDRMALSPGSRLGPYEIVAPLGAGGMGE